MFINLAKFLVPILEPYAYNDYTVKNSYDLCSLLTNFKLPSNFFLASFDIVSFFTNIPVDETIVILDLAFTDNTLFHNFNQATECGTSRHIYG